MITLSSTLLASQKTLTYNPIWKIVLSPTAGTTKGYDLNRVLSISHSQEPNSHKAEIILNNQGNLVTSIDFEDYQSFISYGMKTGVAGTVWAASTTYTLDNIRLPITSNGYQYRCAVAGVAGSAQPTWPTDLGVRVADSAVTWEMDGNSGDEYSYTAPTKERVQELHSGRGILKCILRTVGIPDQMAEDKALSEYTQTSSDTNTVKTLISAIAGATLLPFTGYTAITVVYDSEDSIIGTFCPKDYFSVSVNESRWDKIEELLGYTRCKARIGNDGKLHIFVPRTTGKTWVTATTYVANDYAQPVTPNNNFTYQCTTAGTSGAGEPAWPTTDGGTVVDGGVTWTARGFHYEYKFDVTGDHTFWNKTIRLRFVNPNKVIVKSHPDHEAPQYTGSATSATSYALDPKTQTLYRRLASNAQAESIAKAMIERYELDAERGFATVPMNVGQELWDYVKVTDSRQGDIRIGNIQYLQRTIKIPEGRESMTFSMALAFGKVSAESIMANMLTAGTGGVGETIARLSNAQILTLIDALYAQIARLDGDVDTLWANQFRDTIPKLTVTESLNIPVWS